MKYQAALLLGKISSVPTGSHGLSSFIGVSLVVLISIGTLLATLFIVIGGLHYISSSGDPVKLEHAKKTIKNAIIGLVLLIGSSLIVSILVHSFSVPSSSAQNVLPSLSPIQNTKAPTGLVDVLIKAITGLLQNVIVSAGKPFLDALKQFTISTPLMSSDKSVFSLWITVLGIADTLFVLVIAALALHIMSYATFGMEELEIKTLLPRIGLIFVLMNCSIFVIDGVISLSNAMIKAIRVAFPYGSVWNSLINISSQPNLLGLAALMITIIFLVLAAILLVFYVGRLVTLYLGAVLAPIVCLLFLVPSLKDFALNAVKSYLSTIFVLFVHVIILVLAASIFAGINSDNSKNATDPIMSLVLGLATIVALLKTQGVLNQLSYASIGPRTARKLGGQLINGISTFSALGRGGLYRSSMTSRSSGTLNGGSPRATSNFQQGGSGITTGSKPLNRKPVAEAK